MENHTTLVGKFYRATYEYTQKFKIGGDRKLQKLIGKELFYKVGKKWWFNNPTIIRMSNTELINLIAKVENA